MRTIPDPTSERGQALPIVAVFLLVLLVVCGMVIDVGNAYRVRQALQASTDAAAAAGAGTLTNSYPPDPSSGGCRGHPAHLGATADQPDRRPSPRPT